MTDDPVLVLVDIDHRDGGLALLREVARQAAGAVLHVAYVIPFGFYSYVEPYVSEESQAEAAARAKVELEDLIAEAGLAATPHVLRGGIGEQALLLAEALKARLMIVNATRQDSAHTTLGTHAAQIARHAPCSVLLVRA